MHPQKRSGPPTKRTPENRRIVVNSLKMGLSYLNASALAGMSSKTLSAWREDEAEFDEECKAAIAQARTWAAGKLRERIDRGDTAATIFFLKSRAPEFREASWIGDELKDSDFKMPKNLDSLEACRECLHQIAMAVLENNMSVQLAGSLRQVVESAQNSLVIQERLMGGVVDVEEQGRKLVEYSRAMEESLDGPPEQIADSQGVSDDQEG